MKSENIDKVFPLYAVENDLIVSKKGDITVGYKLKLPQVYSLDRNAIDRINQLFDKIIRSMPENTIIQKQDYFFIDTIKEAIAKGKQMLSRSDNKFFYEKPTLSHECYLFFTKDAKKKVSLSSNPKLYEKYLEEVDDFLRVVSTNISFLAKEEFFEVDKLDSDTILEVIGKYLSLSNKGEQSLKDLFFDGKLRVGDKVAEIFAITSYDQLPLSLESTKKNIDFSTQKTDFHIPFIQPICLGLECNHIYNQVIYIDKSDGIFSKLKTKLNQFKSLAILSKENEVTYDQINELVNNVIEKELRFVNQHFNLIIWNNTEEELENSKNQLENSFNELGIIPYQIKHAIKDIYLNNIPGATVNIPENYKFIGISEQTPILFNFESYYEGNKDGILFCDRKNGAPVRLDLWDEPLKRGLIVNRNRLIFGPSGTGKSFLINHIASQYYEQGHHIVMIDIGNSYKKLCQLVNGQYFAYDLDSPLQFNPFYFKHIDEINNEKKVFLISLIIFLWKGDDPFKREEKQIIGLYVDAYYDSFSNGNDEFPCLSSFYKFVENNTTLDEEAKYFDKTSFKLSLRDFHDGKYDQILNSREQVDLIQERFIVFEMDNIKDHPVLFPLVTMLCIDVVMSKIRKIPEVKKSIFIDECWKPISSGEMAEFIKYLYKTVRKFYGEVAIATQDVEDILDTPAGPAMINNTDTMILLSHKKKMATKDKFAQHLSFSESDLEKLFSTDKREVFIKVGSVSNVYKVTVSPERYACYSSNADENKFIFDMYKKKKNMKLALNEFVEKQ
ncbi:TraG family conjugative transposon ATPase [Aquimarina sp. MMG016]|uniref:TraG family conjugative transposon ATPase n=1 Tax=Aquimarina sp. MMG016 TaxID=2822690 RepID=UPI001B39E34B|nr:TraG family conjugative transposon ATPase [Aquimarina sp. MMG016]MBQ4820593.1 TraG family conjugative transposon ATPase [Aquimarina sp. MMG016]